MTQLVFGRTLSNLHQIW